MTTMIEILEDSLITGFESVNEAKEISCETPNIGISLEEFLKQYQFNDFTSDYYYIDTEHPTSPSKTRTIYEVGSNKPILSIKGTGGSPFIKL